MQADNVNAFGAELISGANELVRCLFGCTLILSTGGSSDRVRGDLREDAREPNLKTQAAWRYGGCNIREEHAVRKSVPRTVGCSCLPHFFATFEALLDRPYVRLQVLRHPLRPSLAAKLGRDNQSRDMVPLARVPEPVGHSMILPPMAIYSKQHRL